METCQVTPFSIRAHLDTLDSCECILLKLKIAEDLEKYLNSHLDEVSDFTRAYTETYLTLVIEFERRTGKVPDLVRRIAEVWATGLAQLAIM